MSQDNQSDQLHIIGEMFDAANVAQPVPPTGIPGGITPANIQPPAPRSQRSPAKNGFTTDNLQQPAPAPSQEAGDE